MYRPRVLCLLISSILLTPLAHAEAPAATTPAPAREQPANASSPDKSATRTDKNGEPIVTLSALRVTAQSTPASTARIIQQYAPNMVNVISAATIEKLPDVNAAEAVSRVPGISLETDTGEGRFVNIRGMDADLNGTTFGGVRIPPTNTASPSGAGRAVAFDSIPAGLIGAITVTKTNTPDQDAEALGGTIEITPKQVPPGKDRFLNAEVGGGLDNLRNTGVKDFSVSGGGRFGFGDSAYKPFSFIGTLAYFENRRGVDDVEASYADDQAAGTPDKVFNGFEQRYYDNYHRRRHGFGGELDYQPDENNRFYARYFDAGYTESVHYRQRLIYNLYQDGPGSVMADPNNPNGFIDHSATFDKTTRDERETVDTRVAALGGENQFHSFKVDYVGSLAIGSYNKPFDYNSDFATSAPSTVAYDNISDPRFPRVSTVSGPSPLDPANFTLNGYQNSSQHIHDQEYAGAINVTVPTGFFQGDDENIKVGVSGRLRNRHGYGSRYRYDTPAVPLTQFAGNNSVTLYDGHYQNGPNIDAGALRNFFYSNRGLFTRSNLNGDQQADAEGDATAKEDVYAGYAQYHFNPVERLGVLAGVRVERTQTTYGANAILLDPASGDYVGAVPQQSKHNYTNLFPTVQARYELTDSLILRGSYSKTIARPGFNQITASTTIDPSSNSVSRGNPDLKPITSNNLDASLEYYFGDAGIASISVFNKQLSNYIVTQQQTGVILPNTGVYAGFNGPANIYTFANISHAFARGLELNYQQKYTMLPGWMAGLGMTANYTLVDSRAEIRPGDFELLPSTSKNTGNLAFTYDLHGLHLDLGAYYISKNIFGVGNSPATDVWSQPRFSLDLGSTYAIDSHISVFFNIKNLTDTRLKFTEGPGANRPIQREFYGQTYTAGVRVAL
ncbi:MAG: TonB-dependent receptor [Pseudomonadota bacterium]|nr:TonB-dependent receptor [Pseudomonadota bacterium]